MSNQENLLQSTPAEIEEGAEDCLLSLPYIIDGQEVEFKVYRTVVDAAKQEIGFKITGSVGGEMKEFLMRPQPESSVNYFSFEGVNIPQELLDDETAISDAIIEADNFDMHTIEN